MQPLDGPVVPPVYTNVASDDGRTAGGGGTEEPASRSSQPWTVAPVSGSAAPPTTTTWSRPSTVGTTGPARSDSDASTIRTREPESASWWRRYSPLYAVLIGTATPPASTIPHHENMASGEFSISVATRSPGPTPRAINAPASRPDTSATSAAVAAVPVTSR